MQSRPSQQSGKIEQVLREFNIRPLRFGFIINRGIKEATLQQIYQYNTSLWGGRYNLFVPSDGTSIRNDWLRQLYFHDPDVIFFVGDIDANLGDEIYRKILSMPIFQWHASI